MVVEATAQKKLTKDFRAEVAALKDTVSEQATTIRQLQAELQDADQQRRLTNLEIQGLPSTPNENLGVVLCDLASKIGIHHFQLSDVLSGQRIPYKKAENPGNALLIFGELGVGCSEGAVDGLS